MADPSPLDPFAVWRQMLSQWEQGTNRAVTEASGSDAINEGMHRLMGTGLAAKKVSDELSARTLAALNLPSRADVEALGARLASIEERLVELALTLDSLVGPRASAPAGPRRTKRPPPDDATAPAETATPAKKTAKRTRR